MSIALMMSIKSGAKLVISSENYKHSSRFFIFYADFCYFVVRIIQHNQTFSIHLPHAFCGFVLVISLYFHNAA